MNNTSTAQELINARNKAIQRYADPSDHEIEIDDIAKVVESGDGEGYWVAARVWVRKEES
jgi:hypothetical protein